MEGVRVFIKMNNGDIDFERGNVIRIFYVDNNHIVSVHGVVIEKLNKFITVVYLTNDIKHSDKRLPIIEVENNTYRVTPILFYVFRDFYKYVDVVTTLDKDMLELIKLTIEQPTDNLSYRIKRFYKKEIDKYLMSFYDMMISSVVKNDI